MADDDDLIVPRRRVADVLGYARRIGDDEDILNRLSSLEANRIETQFLLRESAAMSSRLNDTLIEMKEEFKSMRLELHDIHDLELVVASLQAGFSIVKWAGGALGGIAIVLATGYAAKVIGVAI